MTETRHLIVEGSSSSVDNGGAGTMSYHTLYLPHAIQETNQQSFATDGALLSDNSQALQGTDDTNRHGPPCRIFARPPLRNSNEATHAKSLSVFCSQPASV
jgi:hypothetical protein